MAYQNKLFPSPKLVHGIRKEVIKNTSIISNGNTEYRISKMANARQRWIIPARAMSYRERGVISQFLIDMGMSLDSFDFMCPFQNQVYKVRLDQDSYNFSAEALNQDNSVAYVNMSDITLIQVFE